MPAKILQAISFSPEQLRELRYAALLHDFGKVGVREPVLVKAKKLYPEQFEVLKYRFAFAKKEREAHFWQSRCKLMEQKMSTSEFKAHLESLERELESGQKELDSFWDFIQKCNEPSVLESGGLNDCKKLAKYR